MITGTAKLIIDAGNSETRVTAMYGKTKKGVTRRRTTILSNRYAVIDPTAELPTDVDEFNSAIFTLSGEMNGNPVSGEYGSGLLVAREYSKAVIRPTAMKKKFSSITTFLTLNMAFMEGYRLIASMNGTTVDSVDVEWEVSVLLPPGDVGSSTIAGSGVQQMAQMVRSVKQINFSMPQITKDITVVEGGIRVVPEGFAAYMGVVYLPDHSIRPGYEGLLDENVMIIDIGAGTTDFTVIDRGTPVENTKYTINTGGNNVATALARIYATENGGVNIGMPAASRAVVTGFVRDGAARVDVTDMISRAKSEVAATLIGGVAEFFEQNGYNPRSINQLLVVGGGAETSDIEGMRPISDFLVAEMKTYSPNVGIVDLPTETRQDPETGTPIEATVSPRTLNIKGAAILAG